MDMKGWTTLVEPTDLAHALGRKGLVVLDARFDLASPGAGLAHYRTAHVPGALHADLDRDLSDHGQSGMGRHPWPGAARFAATLGRWGVSPGDQVVVYDAADGALAAARAWCLLRMLGHERVAVLDGGWAAWREALLPIESAAVPMPPPSVYPSTGGFDKSRLLDADDVQGHLANDGMLIDARAAERFRGDVEPIDRVAGHVPGAINRPYAENLHSGRFKPADQLAREFAALIGAGNAKDVVVMCGSGVTACHHLLALAHAGMPGAGLFTGSWSGWTSDPSRPVATGP